MHALAMPSIDGGMSPEAGMESHADKSVPNDCVAQCLAKTHDFNTMLANVRVSQLLPVLTLVLALVLLLPLVMRFSSASLSPLARPPDLIKLYAHYRI